MILYWKAQTLATAGFALFGAYRWTQHEMHLRATVPVTATVDRIDRQCGFVDSASGVTSRGACPRASLAAAYQGTRRITDIDGTAEVTITYSAPQNGSFQVGRLHVDGHQDLFYRLRSGDPVAIRVDRQDPSRFTTD